MKTMKRNWGKLLKFFLAGFFVFLLLDMIVPFYVFANNISSSSPGVGVITIENPLEHDTFQDLLTNIAKFLFYLSLPVAALMIIYAAYTLLTSAGEPAKVEKAKKIIFWAITGVIILYLSAAFINFLENMIGASNNP